MLNLLNVLIVCFSWAQEIDFNKFVGEFALDDSTNETRYVQISKQERNKLASKDNLAVSYSFYPNGTNLSSGSYSAEKEKVTLPIHSITVNLQNIPREIKTGKLVLGSDNLIYYIENVYPDGRIAAYKASVNRNSRNKILENFIKEEKKNIVIMHIDDIKAVEVPSFRGYTKNRYVNNLEGIPICDKVKLGVYGDYYGLPQNFPNNGCTKSKKFFIPGIFSDGSIAYGQLTFNVFPSAIERYRYIEQTQVVN